MVRGGKGKGPVQEANSEENMNIGPNKKKDLKKKRKEEDRGGGGPIFRQKAVASIKKMKGGLARRGDAGGGGLRLENPCCTKVGALRGEKGKGASAYTSRGRRKGF